MLPNVECSQNFDNFGRQSDKFHLPAQFFFLSPLLRSPEDRLGDAPRAVLLAQGQNRGLYHSLVTSRDAANFRVRVLGCIEAKFCM